MGCKMNLKMAVKNDYLLGLALLFPLACILVPAILIATKRIDTKSLCGMSFKEMLSTFDFRVLAAYSLIVLAGLILFAKRILYIKSFETESRIVDAKVVDINYEGDRCGVDVEFILSGVNCKKHFAFFKNKQTKYINIDSEIKLIVKNENPKKCLIKNLYFD